MILWFHGLKCPRIWFVLWFGSQSFPWGSFTQITYTTSYYHEPIHTRALEKTSPHVSCSLMYVLMQPLHELEIVWTCQALRGRLSSYKTGRIQNIFQHNQLEMMESCILLSLESDKLKVLSLPAWNKREDKSVFWHHGIVSFFGFFYGNIIFI